MEPIRRNNHHEDRNDIRPNDNAIERDNHMEIENNVIPNAFRENNHFENEDDIEPNNVIEGDNLMEVENDIIPNHFNEDENQGGNVPNGYERRDPEGEEQDVKTSVFSMLDPYSLEHIKNVLYIGLHQLFDKFEIKIVRCPCLTRPPYNLAAVGLSGDPSILLVGSADDLIPIPKKYSTYNIRRLLLEYCYNFFVIGAGYAAEDSMSANGHLTINATISPPGNVTNNSRIVYEEADTEERILKTINDPNRMKCSMFGNFFLSEGRSGKVIEVRAKGRRTKYDIISLIQYCLYYYNSENNMIALGGVLMINGGQVVQLITPENYPERFPTTLDFYRWLRWHELRRNLITVGALTNSRITHLGPLRDESSLLVTKSRYKFNSFSNCEAAGQFMNDVTPNETEYVGYFNVAQKLYIAVEK